MPQHHPAGFPDGDGASADGPGMAGKNAASVHVATNGNGTTRSEMISLSGEGEGLTGAVAQGALQTGGQFGA